MLLCVVLLAFLHACGAGAASRSRPQHQPLHGNVWNSSCNPSAVCSWLVLMLEVSEFLSFLLDHLLPVGRKVVSVEDELLNVCKSFMSPKSSLETYNQA